MLFGFVSISQADNYLKYNPNYSDWKKTISGIELSGVCSTNGDSKTLIGNGTLFSSELIANDYLDIDNNTCIVNSITSETELELNESINIDSENKLYKLTLEQYNELSTLYERKRNSLMTAYYDMIYNQNYIIPETSNENKIKLAQCLIALNIFNTGISSNLHLDNQMLGIQSYSIGEITYSYKFNGRYSGQIGGLLQEYFKLPSGVTITR